MTAPGAIQRPTLSRDARILMTGSRDYADEATAAEALQAALALLGVPASRAVLVHGGARGADAVLAQAAQQLSMGIEEHPAQWSVHGGCWCRDTSPGTRCGYAGHRRNDRMLASGADLCLSFPTHPLELAPGEPRQGTSRGTWDMTEKASAAGVPTLVIWPDGVTHVVAAQMSARGVSSPQRAFPRNEVARLMVAIDVARKGFADPGPQGSVPLLDLLLPF